MKIKIKKPKVVYIELDDANFFYIGIIPKENYEIESFGIFIDDQNLIKKIKKFIKDVRSKRE